MGTKKRVEAFKQLRDKSSTLQKDLGEHSEKAIVGGKPRMAAKNARHSRQHQLYKRPRPWSWVRKVSSSISMERKWTKWCGKILRTKAGIRRLWSCFYGPKQRLFCACYSPIQVKNDMKRHGSLHVFVCGRYSYVKLLASHSEGISSNLSN